MWRLRKAIASAIDRKKLVEEVLKQRWHVPAQSVVPPDIPGSQAKDPSVGFPYNPEAAKKFLAEAGYGPDKPVPPVDLWINREGNNESLFRAVADMLEKVGIPVRLNTSKWPVYRSTLEACGGKLKRADATQTLTRVRLRPLSHGLGDGLCRSLCAARHRVQSQIGVPIHRMAIEEVRGAAGAGARREG